MMVCHCLRRGGRKNCCKGNWKEGNKECILAAAGFLLSTQKDKLLCLNKIINWLKKIFLMTTVGVVGTTRGGERVKVPVLQTE